MYSSVTHIFSQRDRDAVAAHVEATAARTMSTFSSNRWRDEIEAALLDAVFSARASYGGPETGVRRVIATWREYRGVDRLDDLTAFSAFADRPDELVSILGNRQRVAGNKITKAEAVVDIAAALIGLGVRHCNDLDDADDQRAAVTAVAGVGPKTWECVLFTAGAHTTDASELISGFVADALGRDIDRDTADVLLAATAESMGVDVRALEHSVWRYQRRLVPVTKRPPLSEVG
ncbi:hypothetical protein [Rhodococcoides yunnanense]|uniref:hypothetical protein n=1 Tax=Rhodococcoides yunnanense TaxID=278209 RepID=UPI0009354FEB|nr:hypothetical protein [Rhodococcus yunnanensis]